MDGQIFMDRCDINGLKAYSCVIVDDTYYLIPTPLNIDIQEYYYSSGYKKIHCVKIFVTVPVLRKWIYPLKFTSPRTSYVCRFHSTATLIIDSEEPEFCGGKLTK